MKNGCKECYFVDEITDECACEQGYPCPLEETPEEKAEREMGILGCEACGLPTYKDGHILCPCEIDKNLCPVYDFSEGEEK